MNYFELFGLPVRFSLDTTTLAQSYRNLQKAIHPDRFAHQGEQAQRIALQKTAQVNDAYQSLKAPLPRAEYMLSLAGIDLKAEQTTMRDTVFLMQQMEWRETLEELRHSKELAGLEDFATEISQEYKAQINEIAQAFDAGAHLTDANHWANEVRKLAFLVKLSQEIAQAEEALEDF